MTRLAMIPNVRAATLFLVAALSASAEGQGNGPWSYQVGARTTFMVSTMRLSELDPAFVDVPAGGKSLMHASSLFLMWPRWRSTSLGVETLVGNSYGTSGSQVLFQAVGVSVDRRTQGKTFAAAGVQGGGMIASATHSIDGDGDGANAGTHYKGSGLFVAPSVSLGRDAGLFELRLLVRHVLHIPGTAHLTAFDATYVGFTVIRKLR